LKLDDLKTFQFINRKRAEYLASSAADIFAVRWNSQLRWIANEAN